MDETIHRFIDRHRLGDWGAALVRTAGTELLARRGELGAWQKPDRTWVSESDLAAEELVVDHLRDRFSSCQVITEERFAGAGSLQDLCWVLDPLDGTANYLAGVPCFCVSLALLYQGAPVLAWTYDPVRDELFQARHGHGASLNGLRIVVPSEPDRALVAAETGLIEPGAGKPPPEELGALMARWGEVLMFGSQAVELAWVAAGRLVAAIAPATRLWDDAAGALLVQEAGGRYCAWDGAPVFPLRDGTPALAGLPFASLAGGPETIDWIVSRGWQA